MAVGPSRQLRKRAAAGGCQVTKGNLVIGRWEEWLAGMRVYIDQQVKLGSKEGAGQRAYKGMWRRRRRGLSIEPNVYRVQSQKSIQ